MKSPASITSRYAFFTSLFGILYGLSALLVFFFSSQFVAALNFIPVLESLPGPPDPFWAVLAACFFSTLSIGFFCTALNPKHNGYRAILFLAHVTSGGGFLYYFFNYKRYLASLLGASFSGVILVFLAWSMVRMTLSKRASKRASEKAFAV